MTARSDTRTESAWIALMPGLFVLLWSAGFFGAKPGLPYAEPFTFLSLRFAMAVLVLLIMTLFVRASWPKSWRETGHIAVAGSLLHAIYLGCI